MNTLQVARCKVTVLFLITAALLHSLMSNIICAANNNRGSCDSMRQDQ